MSRHEWQIYAHPPGTVWQRLNLAVINVRRQLCMLESRPGFWLSH